MCQFLFNGEGREKLRHASITVCNIKRENLI